MAVDDVDLSGENLYDIVGCATTATPPEIRRAYRRRARELHPDVTGDPESAVAFRRLVAAFETLMDDSKRGAYETQRKRANAKERAARQWADVSSRGGWGGGSSTSASARERPAGSRREAEAASREESERRRRRWREMAFEDIWREHMPLEHEASRTAAGRTAFMAALEVAVQAFVRAEAGGRPPPPPQQQSPPPQQQSPPPQQQSPQPSPTAAPRPAAAGLDPEALETVELLQLSNREVLRSELADGRHRTLKHRERVRYLEAELELAAKKADMWRGATPGSESERVQSLQRELEYLQLAKRLRERVGEQRVALERLKAREQALTEHIVNLKSDGRMLVD